MLLLVRLLRTDELELVAPPPIALASLLALVLYLALPLDIALVRDIAALAFARGDSVRSQCAAIL